MRTLRFVRKATVAAALLTVLASSVGATEARANGQEADAKSARFPAHIDLPKGFRPEGIAIKGKRFFVGSLANGAIYRGDLRTGTGAVIYPGETGAATTGLALHHGRIFAAGGATGKARVVDAKTGQLLKTYDLATAPTFINDVAIARGSAWFTDSNKQVLYRVPLDLGPAEVVPLTGDLVYTTGFNVNGIDATANGKTLVLVQSNTGQLFTSTLAGVTKRIDIGSESVPNGDGILVEGRTLYVVQNQLNKIAVITLDRGLTSGTVVTRLTDDDFDIPTTIDRFGGRLYAVNARFTVPPAQQPESAYWITGVSVGHRGDRGHAR